MDIKNFKKNPGRTGVGIEGVVLAAGFSTRAGAFKMELPFDGKTLIERTVDSMYDLCSRVIVVGGHRIERIIKITEGYRNVRVVCNPHYHTGMFGSVKTGVKHVTAGWFFFIPGDYPLVKKTTYRELLDARSSCPGGSIFIPVYNGRKGHPILVNRRLAEELLNEPEDSNLKKFIRRKGFIEVEVADRGILMDIDTMEDYERAKRGEQGAEKIKVTGEK